MAFAFSTTPTVGVGTISIARNGTTVTGVGTNFQSPSLVGQIILVNGFNSRVTAVASATSMTINRVPSFEIVGETFSFVAGTVNINQSGVDRYSICLRFRSFKISFDRCSSCIFL
jgi:hypothetical protein